MQFKNEFEWTETTEMGIVSVFVEESAANWYVTIKPRLFELPITRGWKVSKKQAKNEHEAFSAVFAEWRERNKNWTKF